MEMVRVRQFSGAVLLEIPLDVTMKVEELRWRAAEALGVSHGLVSLVAGGSDAQDEMADDLVLRDQLRLCGADDLVAEVTAVVSEERVLQEFLAAAEVARVDELDGRETVELVGKSLRGLPPAICALSSVANLNVSNNRLRCLPEELGDMQQLQALQLGWNRLTALPPSLFKLRMLKALFVQGNELTELPDEIGNLTELQVLDLGGNRLTTLPRTLSELRNFQRVFLEVNGERSDSAAGGPAEKRWCLPVQLLHAEQQEKEDGRVELTEGAVAFGQALVVDHQLFESLPEHLREMASHWQSPADVSICCIS